MLPLRPDLAYSAELLEFYRQEVAAFDAERESLVQKVERCRIPFEEIHRARWEKRARDIEMQDLQRQLSDSQVSLARAQRETLDLASENDKLKKEVVEHDAELLLLRKSRSSDAGGGWVKSR